MITTTPLTAQEKIKKARIKLLQEKPFFAYLVMNLVIKENNNMPMKTACVDAFGNLYYDSNFVDGLSLEKTKGLITHEALHCLTPESLILTNEGLKEIKDIRVGDWVYSANGDFTKVLQTFTREYNGKIYEFHPRFGLPVSFTDEHPILAIKQQNYRRGWGFHKSLINQGIVAESFKFYNAKDLKKNDAVMIAIPNTKQMKDRGMFRTRDKYVHKKVFLDEDVAYFLGFFVGDGCLHRIRNKVVFGDNDGKVERIITLTLSLKDDHQRLRDIIKNKFHRKTTLTKLKDKKAVRISFSGKSLAKYLRTNFYRNGEKCIPSWMLFERVNTIKSFVEGLKNADGWESKKGRVNITSVYNGVYSLLPLLILKLGYVPAFSYYERKNPNHKNPYCIAYTKNPKKSTSMMIGNEFVMPICKIIEKDYNGLVYNLETESHTFCVPYFTTHNCGFGHLSRLKGRDMEISNIAMDIVIQNLLLNNGFELIEGTIIPKNNRYEVPFSNIVIKDIDKKIWEEIYDELQPLLKQKKALQDLIKKVLDEHKFSKGKPEDGGGLSKEEQQNIKKWKDLLVEAGEIAKQKGNEPLGVGRYIDRILESKLHWKELLYKYITKEIQSGYSYNSPSKKTLSAGYYVPSVLRENIDIVVSVDVSGSINQEELNTFLSEVVAIAKGFNNIRIKLIVADCIVQNVYDVENGSIEKIMKLEIKGGGGTSHKCVMDYIEDNIPNSKLLVSLTDGFSDIEQLLPPSFNVLWVISKNGVKQPFHFGETIFMEEY